MTAKRLYILLIAIVVLLFAGLVAGTYGANKLLTSQSTQLINSKAKSMALTEEQLTLNNAKEDVKKYAGLEQIAQTIVPEDKDQADAVLEVVNLAAQNGVSLASITFPASTLGTGILPSSSSKGTTTSVTPTANSVINSPSAPLNSLSQLEPVTNIPGVYDLQITVAGDPNKPVGYSSFINFLSALEHNRRTAQISSVTIEPSANNADSLTFNLTLNDYIKP